jgi:hypothetical protein
MPEDIESRITELRNSILDDMLRERDLQRSITERVMKLQSLERSRETIARHHPLVEYARSKQQEVIVGS